MAQEIIELLTQKVAEIRRILHMPDIKDTEMCEFTSLVIQTTKVITVHKHHVEMNGEAGLTSFPIDLIAPKTPPRTPYTDNDTLNPPRRSDRLATKRSYEAMQGGNKKISRSPKKPKPASDEPASAKPTTNKPNNDGPEPATNRPDTGKPATTEPASDITNEIHRQDTDKVLPRSGMDTSIPSGKTTIDELMESDLPHEDGMAILDDYFQNCSADSRPTDAAETDELTKPIEAVCQDYPLKPMNQSNTYEASTAALYLSNTNPNAVSFQSETSDSLDPNHNTSCIPNSSVSRTLDAILATGAFAVYIKILDSIVVNSVKCNRRLIRPILDTEHERLRELKRNRLECIADSRHQMNMTLEAQMASEINYQMEEKQLKKYMEIAIARLDRRELAEKELQDILSEPTELIGEFREESDYENILKNIKKDNADNTRTRSRLLWKQTYYWPLIQQRAKMIAPLPKSSGPKTELTPEEKYAAKELIIAMGYGQSRGNIFKWTSYLKLLYDLRVSGAATLLLYRTNEFKTYFFQHPKELDTLLSWSQVYNFPVQQLRLRVIAEEGNDFSGRCDIDNNRIWERLRISQKGAWRNDYSIWADPKEQENFLADHSIIPTSTESNSDILRHGINSHHDRNKSIYICIMPYEGESGKKTIGNKPASTKLLAICPLVTVAPGDFLGIFSGRIRYIDQKPPKAIKGPIPGLWLDHSELTGKLNQMRVAKTGEKTNVCFVWEWVNEVREKKSCRYWRVLVEATRDIMPFDQLIRPLM